MTFGGNTPVLTIRGLLIRGQHYIRTNPLPTQSGSALPPRPPRVWLAPAWRCAFWPPRARQPAASSRSGSPTHAQRGYCARRRREGRIRKCNSALVEIRALKLGVLCHVSGQIWLQAGLVRLVLGARVSLTFCKLPQELWSCGQSAQKRHAMHAHT